jgi:hypothetical protein
MGAINWLVETVIRNHADIRNLAIDHAEGCLTVEGWGRETIENVRDILKTEVPHAGRGVGGVRRTVYGTFDILPATFFGVILVVRFTFLAVRKDKGAPENIMGPFTDLITTTAVADKLAYPWNHVYG